MNTYSIGMNTLQNSSLRLGFQACLIFVILLGVGCASSKVDWNSRVGSYTMDQAILDLGPPDKKAELTDGTQVTEWLTAKGYAHGSYQSLGGSRYYSGPWVFHYVQPPTPDHFLRLVFSPDGELRSWRKVLK